MRIIGFITPLPQNGGNSQGEVVMDKVVDRSGIPDFMYVKWSNQFFGKGDLLFVLSQEKTRGCQHHSHKELGLAMDTNLYPVALDPDLLYLVLVLVRTWAKGCWASWDADLEDFSTDSCILYSNRYNHHKESDVGDLRVTLGFARNPQRTIKGTTLDRPSPNKREWLKPTIDRTQSYAKVRKPLHQLTK
ncbi:hypothetical protein Acr_00g0001630 [Actinidia rufa]|uniref:Uncharacterized protein n=1 Tax=Actinidia rufa TaxID=165716 RepID=A0A7J0D8H2_9ERIC|nr:hypothetical protein Acr_00g0000200 [Actinidia rufa]GFS28407.1 hypothetical protein Acr_00g0001630 [Actinidia rufa]